MPSITATGNRAQVPHGTNGAHPNGHAREYSQNGATPHPETQDPEIQLLALMRHCKGVIAPVCLQRDALTRADFLDGASGAIYGAARDTTLRYFAETTPDRVRQTLEAWSQEINDNAPLAVAGLQLWDALPKPDTAPDDAKARALEVAQSIQERAASTRAQATPKAKSKKQDANARRAPLEAPNAGELPPADIPAPILTNERGEPEYEPAQLVALLHPAWKVENLATHAAHAQRIRDHLGADLCYSPNLGWLVYDGRCWRRDDKTATRTAARVATLSQVVRDEGAQLYRHAATLAQAGRESDAQAMSKAAAALLRHTKQVESKAFIEGALHLTAGLLTVETERFDQKPWVIGFQNGTWANGVWREHRREDYLLHLSPVTLDFEADRAEWLRVLARISAGDNDFAMMMQDVSGYILSGASHLRALPFFYGPKGTGKSTEAELLQTVLGPMAVTIDPKKLQDSAARERLGADLWNRRLAVCSEAGSQRLEAELLKTLSGGDRLAVRFLFREAFTAPPRHVLLMVTNDPPQMDAYDAALKDRVITLPFVHALGDGAPLELTGGKRIEAVRQDHESPLVRGFAAWAMEGLQRVFETQDIHRAACAATATAQFWADTDPITPFWETVAESELRAGVTKTDLRKRYEAWCESEGARPLNRNRWAKACESHGLKDEQRSGGTRFWYLSKVAQVAQLSTFSNCTRETSKPSHVPFENSPSYATYATNDSAHETAAFDTPDPFDDVEEVEATA